MASAGLARFRLPGISRREQAPEAPPPPASVRLPLLAEVFSRLQNQPRRIIADFAPANPVSLPVFNGLNCRLQLLDFPSLVKLLGAAQGAEHFRRLMNTAMIKDPGQPADLVLSWDYLNYLPRAPISLITQDIGKRMAPGAYWHALIAYSAEQMPAHPCHFTLQSQDHVRIDPAQENSRDAPRYAPNDLLRCMPGFRMEKAILLKNGYQEYLFQRLSDDHSSAQQHHLSAVKKQLS